MRIIPYSREVCCTRNLNFVYVGVRNFYRTVMRGKEERLRKKEKVSVHVRVRKKATIS